MKNDINNIFNDYILEIIKELNFPGLDYHKLYEEIFRFIFYKTLLKNNYKNNDIIYEANFSKKTIDKIDMKFGNNFIEIKFNRTLENGNVRPFPYSLGKVLADIYKLSKIKIIENKYFLYVFDTRFKKYIQNNKLSFLLDDKNDIKINGKKFHNYPKIFIKQLPFDFNEYNLNFKLIKNHEILLDNNNKISICLYIIK